MNFEHRETVKAKLLDVPVNQVQVRHDRPRRNIDPDVTDRMMLSLSTTGQLQPIGVRQHGGGWILIFGYLRLHSAKELDWKTIQAIEYPETENAELVDLALWATENLNHIPPSFEEMAVAINQFADAGMSDSAIASVLGKPVNWVNGMLSVARDPLARQLIALGWLTDIEAWTAFLQLAPDLQKIVINGSELITRQTCEQAQAQIVQGRQKKTTPILQKPCRLSPRADCAPDLFGAIGNFNQDVLKFNDKGAAFNLFGASGIDREGQ